MSAAADAPDSGTVFHYDLVCPYSYLLMGEVEAAEEAGVAVRWSPYELRPAPEPLPDPRGRYIRDHWRGQVYPLAVRRGVEIHVPTAQPRSTLVLAAAGLAEERGVGRTFRDAAHAAFFVEGRDVGDEGVLRLRRHAGDPEALVQALRAASTGPTG